ncbi:hypothetical protein V1264_024290 [Littorina saxatilis]|uniref:Fucolectin tachylectin-4 pentraxin-1 domain-containing protein n=1 Tax=Littorina saxatilis TaxID=31220 RepID=A0AAN9AML5_9CAEN
MLLLGPYAASCFLLCVLTLAKWVMSQTGCNCTGSCNMIDACYTTDCSEKNVAVGKTADSSPLYSNSHPACVAVNGITDSDGDCVETAQNDVNPFWRVDLGQNYTIQNMTIYGRASWFGRMRGLKMYVDHQLCHTIGDESYYTPHDGRPVPINVQCNTPLTGSHVTLVKNFTGTVDILHYEILSVCEVQVWATPPPTTTTTTTTIATTSTTTAPIIYPKTTPTARTAITAVPSGLTSKTSIAISNSSTMTRPKEDSPQNTSTDTLVTVIAGAVGAVVALLIAAIIAVFVVMRKKRRKTPDPGHSTGNSAAHPADNKIAVIDDDVTTGGFVSVAEDHTTDNDTASTTDNVYEIIEESGHYYEPLSHRDNTYINDNTMYTTPVFTKEEEGGAT